jgi:hypothetical protein
MGKIELSDIINLGLARLYDPFRGVSLAGPDSLGHSPLLLAQLGQCARLLKRFFFSRFHGIPRAVGHLHADHGNDACRIVLVAV